MIGNGNTVFCLPTLRLLFVRVWVMYSNTGFMVFSQTQLIHCKKNWRSSSTPACGDAGPIQPGVGKRFWHPWRQFYQKYRTFSTDFYKCRTSSTDIKYLKTDATRAWTYTLRFTFQCSTTAPHFLLVEVFSFSQRDKSSVRSSFHIKISLWNLSNENSNKIRQKRKFSSDSINSV